MTAPQELTLPAPAGRADLLRWLIPVSGVALLTLMFIRIGPGPILALIESIGFNLLIVVAVYGCHECVRALALSRCLVFGDRPPFRQLLRIRFLAETVRVLTHTGPFLAEPARAWMLARQGLAGARAYAAAVSELIANSAVSAAATVFVVGYALSATNLGSELAVLSRVLFWASLIYTLAVVAALATRTYVIGGILRGMGALPVIGRRLKTDPRKVRDMEDAILHVLRDNPATLAQVVLLECLAQVILVFDNYWAIKSMGVAISMSTASLTEMLTKPVNIVQLVGITEGGYTFILGWLGMTAAVGFALSLVKRVRSLLVAAAGLVLLAQTAPTLHPTSDAVPRE